MLTKEAIQKICNSLNFYPVIEVMGNVISAKLFYDYDEERHVILSVFTLEERDYKDYVISCALDITNKIQSSCKQIRTHDEEQAAELIALELHIIQGLINDEAYSTELDDYNWIGDFKTQIDFQQQLKEMLSFIQAEIIEANEEIINGVYMSSQGHCLINGAPVVIEIQGKERREPFSLIVDNQSIKADFDGRSFSGEYAICDRKQLAAAALLYLSGR